jgi:outer membrane cobalamin receptor
MKKFLLLWFTAFFSISSVFSQKDATINADTINLDEVVVTGSPVKVNKNNVPMAVSVVTEKQISESDESSLLPVLNGRVPGLFVTERGVTGFGVSTGAAGQISIRGISENPTTGVLILIDGHPQFMGIFGHPLADAYVASDVERVEVIRGPASLLYGSNAMGGVINIITKKQHKDGLMANARLQYGSFNTQKYMASVGYRKNKFSAMASFNHDQTDGYRKNSDFNINNGYVKTGYEFNSHLRASADFSIASFHAMDPGPDTVNAEIGDTIDITRGYWSVTLDNEFESMSGTLKFFYNFGEHSISDGFHSNDANYGLNFFEAFKFFKGNCFTIGTDLVNYGGKVENVIDTTVYEAGVYGFFQQELFNQLTLNAGLRLQDHKVFGTEWIPGAGFAWKIMNNLNWKGNVSKGYRSPTIRELFMWNHNVDLKPEEIMNYETGILCAFPKPKISFELTGFIDKGNNLIVAGEMGKLYNTGKVQNAGIEIAAASTTVKNLEINVTYSYINMKYPVYATPESQLFLGANYQFKKLGISANIKQINGLDTDPSPVINTDENYTLLNGKITYKIIKYASIYLSSENLLNSRYETIHYYPMPGVTAFLGVDLKF